MSEHAPVPFCAEPPPGIEPIDLVSIPNDLRDEIRRLQTHIDGTYKTLTDIRERRAWRTAIAAGLVVTLPILVFSVLQFLHGPWSLKMVLIVPAFTVFLNIVLLMIMHELRPPKTAKVLEVEASRRDLNRKLSKLQSLERLTDQSSVAAALRDEARAFNRDLENLGNDVVSSSTAAQIEEKRAAILARIDDFRKQAVDVDRI